MVLTHLPKQRQYLKYRQLSYSPYQAAFRGGLIKSYAAYWS
jgi:hypothetical protein